MLPFLQKKKVAGLIISQRKPDENKEQSQDDSSNDDALKACARELIQAIGAGDEAGVARAIKSAFEILDASPHVEGPHTEE